MGDLLLSLLQTLLEVVVVATGRRMLWLFRIEANELVEMLVGLSI